MFGGSISTKELGNYIPAFVTVKGMFLEIYAIPMYIIA